MKKFAFDGLWQGKKWIESAVVTVGAKGIIESVGSGPAPSDAEKVPGFALPGVPNAHSHAFQFALAGLAEHIPAAQTSDDFWSWREAMYGLALEIGPETTEAIAAYLYGELAAKGFTSVAEFHYLHHQTDGTAYSDRTAIAESLCRAATKAGIRLTLVPVHYAHSDFGKPPTARQRRFLFKGAKDYLDFAGLCAAVCKRHGHGIGGGVHSLRASSFEETKEIFRALPAEWPRHLHIAEQKKEVDACVKASGKRPVEWALEHLGLGEKFHLVHATHTNEAEVSGLAASGANVVLCPTTEGNLGDGFFDAAAYLEAGGRFSIGTDSHVGIDPWEEFRLLDYGQRLRLERRNPLCQPGKSSGEVLLREAVLSGARAMGLSGKSFLEKGDFLDAAVLAKDDPFLGALRREHRIDTRIYAGGAQPLFGTLVAGEWVSKSGRHVRRDSLAEAARAAFANRR